MVSMSNYMSGLLSAFVTPLISFDKLWMSGVMRHNQHT